MDFDWLYSTFRLTLVCVYVCVCMCMLALFFGFKCIHYATVQTPLQVDPAISSTLDLKLNDTILVRPAKAGEIAERFNHYYVIRDGSVARDCVKTYRGFGECLH
jgi:hypothetical protein